MPTDAPALSDHEVRDELVAIHRHRHRTLATAIFARPRRPLDAYDVFEVPLGGGPVRFRIHRARSEFEMREALLDDNGVHPAILVEFVPARLPVDIIGRIAGGRVYPLVPERRLGRLFGTQIVNPEVLACELLCSALLDETDPHFPNASGPGVDLPLAWRALLAARASFPESFPLSAERLLEHVETSTRGPTFGTYLETRPGLTDALLAHLEGVAGPVGPLLLRAWITGRGHDAAAMSIVLEAAAPRIEADAALRIGLKGILRVFGPEFAELVTARPDVLRRWGSLAAPLLLRVNTEKAIGLIRDADRYVDDDDVKASLRESRFLATGFEQGCDALATAIVAWFDDRTPARFDAAKDALARIEQHRQKDIQPHAGAIERARMAVRLMGYIHARSAQPAESAAASTYEPMISRAEHYVSDGGFVDRARRVARGGDDSRLSQATRRVIEATDDIRDRDDEEFARSLAEWNRNGRQGERVVPIEDALVRFVVPFLKDDTDRKVLVLLLDGMSWAAAVELITDLEDHYQWSPLAWRGTKSTSRLPMIAVLPTITEVSRSSFFAGKLIAGTEPTTTANDPQRFADHAGLNRLLGEHAALLIAPNVTDANGDASQDARKLIASDRRVVGLVVNAIDDQLKSSKQIRIEYTVSSIRPLHVLLESARESGRAVFLVADHGHVLGSRLQRVGFDGAVAGARWRGLLGTHQPAASEIVFDGDKTWRRRGMDRVALLFRETETYGAGGREGEHGGASLAEVVTPALFIGAEGLAQVGSQPDPELERVPLARPSWWNLEVPAAVRPHVRVRSETPRRRPVQIPLLDEMPAPAKREPQRADAGAPTESPWRARLEETEAFGKMTADRRKRYMEMVVPALVELADRAGLASEDVLVQRLRIIPQRLRGLVSTMQECVNIDGLSVIEHDTTGRQVRLDLALLEQIIGADR